MDPDHTDNPARSSADVLTRLQAAREELLERARRSPLLAIPRGPDHPTVEASGVVSDGLFRTLVLDGGRVILHAKGRPPKATP